MNALVIRPGHEQTRMTWPHAGPMLRSLLLEGVDQIPVGLEARLPKAWRVAATELVLFVETPDDLPAGAELWEVRWRLLGSDRWNLVSLVDMWVTYHDVRFHRLEAYTDARTAADRYHGYVHQLES